MEEEKNQKVMAMLNKRLQMGRFVLVMHALMLSKRPKIDLLDVYQKVV